MRVEGLAVARRDAGHRDRLRVALLLEDRRQVLLAHGAQDDAAGHSGGKAMTSTRWPAGETTHAARGAPVAGALLGGNAGVAHPAHGRVELLDDHGRVALGRDDRVLGVEQVHLAVAGLHPGRALAQRRRRGDLGEAEQLPERDLALDRLAAHLERDVVHAHCRAHPLEVLGVDALLRRAPAGERQVLQVLQVREVLAQDRRARARRRASRRAPGRRASACSTSGRRRRASRGRRRASRPR